MITPILLGESGTGEDRRPLHCYLVQSDEANILVNTGIGSGDEGIDRSHAPEVKDIAAAIRETSGITADEVDIVINTSLMPDHCGNNSVFHRPPVYIQTAEYDAAMSGTYTVMEWFNPMVVHYQQLAGDYQVTDHVKVLATPGFTHGHQSVLVETDDGSELIIGRAILDADEFEQHLNHPVPCREAADEAGYLASAKRLLALNARRAYFTHAGTPWQPD